MSDRETISNTARRDFTRCRRQYYFRYNERLEPLASAPALSFGKLIHSCLEKFHQDKAVFFDDVIREWRDSYIAEVNAAAAMDPDLLFEIDSSKIIQMSELAKGMMAGYVLKYADDLNQWEILAVEEPFRIPLHVPCSQCGGVGKMQSPETKTQSCVTCNGTGIGRKSPRWDQVGKLDLVIRVRKSNLVWTVENKTTSETEPHRYEANLLLDTQPRSYIWAVKQLAEQRGWGKVGGLLYNVLRKKLPADPHELQCKSCKGSGKPTRKAQKEGHKDTCPTCVGTGVIGISEKQGTDTTFDRYLAAIRKHPHLDLNSYTETLEKLKARGDRFFWRFYHHVSQADLSDWELETYQVTRDIATTERYYRNPDACNALGRRCPFRRICTEDDPIARRNFKVRGEQHPELAAEEIDLGF